MSHHRFTLNGSFCVLIYARTNNIFPILTLGSNLDIKKESIAHFSVFFCELLGGAAKILGSKMKILLF